MAEPALIGLTELIDLPGATFWMGSDEHYGEEAPAHLARVEPFAIEQHQVTNARFAQFVEATGYVTVAERPLDEAEYPQMSAAERAPGSLVFTPTTGPVDLTDWRQWWRWQPGAHWRTPLGPDGPRWQDRREHPVVQVCFVDALAYAAWAGRRLPSEVEMEFAARGGLDRAEFAWGEELRPGGQLMANTWQGKFPYLNDGARGWAGTAPVGAFPANGYGLHDMIGNAWEWTSSPFTPDHREAAAQAAREQAGRDPGFVDRGPAVLSLAEGDQAPDGGCGCSCGSGEGPLRSDAGVVSDAGDAAPRDPIAWAAALRKPDPSRQRVTKGGSHLCAPEYCMRYRPAARSAQTEDSATSHIGFRCAQDRSK